jgi:hypothetical protein
MLMGCIKNKFWEELTGLSGKSLLVFASKIVLSSESCWTHDRNLHVLSHNSGNGATTSFFISLSRFRHTELTVYFPFTAY